MGSSVSMTLESALLVKRYAWRMMLPREDKPSASDVRDNLRAVRELVMIGVLDYVMLDLESSLTDAGLYRQGVKKTIRRCCDVVRSLHDTLYKRILSQSDEARRHYSRLRDDGYFSLRDHVVVNGIETYVSEVRSLCRLILSLNDSLRGRYDYRPIDDLALVLREVGELGYDDANIDFLVDYSIKTP